MVSEQRILAQLIMDIPETIARSRSHFVCYRNVSVKEMFVEQVETPKNIDDIQTRMKYVVS
jgi:hypothetical protein